MADPYDIATYVNGSRQMAVVTSQNKDTVQLLDITIHDDILDAGLVRDGETFAALDGASHVRVISVDEETHTLISSHERIQIINMTAGMSPTSAVALGEARGLDVADVESGQYAVAAAGSSVHVVNITDISAPHVLSVVNSTTEGMVPLNVAVMSDTYALVTWSSDDASYGLQVVNITDPSAPGHMAWVGDYRLDGAYDMAAASIGSDTYALITAYRSGGLAVLNMSNVTSPNVASWVQFPGATHVSYMEGRAAVTSFANDGVYLVCIQDGTTPNVCLDKDKVRTQSSGISLSLLQSLLGRGGNSNGGNSGGGSTISPPSVLQIVDPEDTDPPVDPDPPEEPKKPATLNLLTTGELNFAYEQQGGSSFTLLWDRPTSGNHAIKYWVYVKDPGDDSYRKILDGAPSSWSKFKFLTFKVDPGTTIVRLVAVDTSELNILRCTDDPTPSTTNKKYCEHLSITYP